jgi:Maltose-binding periplasmic proteins/domains
MKQNWKKVISGLMVGMMIFSLAACNSDKKNEEEAGSASGKTLSIGIWGGNDQESAAIDKLKEEFEKNTGAKVEIKVYTDYNTQIQADFIAGTAPDTFYIDASIFPFYSELGVMEPLDAKEMDADKFAANLMGAFTAADGTIYCIPKDVSTLATYYNEDILNAVGVSPADIPDALEDYQEFLVELQAKLDEEYGAGAVAAMTYNPELARQLYVLEAGQASIMDKEGNSTLSNDVVVENIQFIADMVEAGGLKTPADLGLGWNGEAFGVGKTAIMEEGNWVYGTLKADYSDINFGVKEMPTYKGTRYSMSFTVGWGISATSKEKDLAKEWIKYVTGVEGMTIWCEGAGCLPSRTDVAEAMKVNDDAVWKVHTEMIAVAIPWQKGTTIEIINNAYKNFILAAFSGEESVEEAMERADKQANGEISNAQ